MSVEDVGLDLTRLLSASAVPSSTGLWENSSKPHPTLFFKDQFNLLHPNTTSCCANRIPFVPGTPEMVNLPWGLGLYRQCDHIVHGPCCDGHTAEPVCPGKDLISQLEQPSTHARPYMVTHAQRCGASHVDMRACTSHTHTQIQIDICAPI